MCFAAESQAKEEPNMTCAMRKTAMSNVAECISALRACAVLNSVYFSFVRFFAGAFYFAYYYFTSYNSAHRTRAERG